MRIIAAIAVTWCPTTTMAHDVSQDGSHAHLPGAHGCHHLRVQYWGERVEEARAKVKALRWQHVMRENRRETPGLAGVEKDVMRRLTKTDTFHEKGVEHLDRMASAKGCYPWP